MNERQYYNKRMQILINNEPKINELVDFMRESNMRLRLPKYNKFDKVFDCLGVDIIDNGPILCNPFRVSRNYKIRKLYIDCKENGATETISKLIFIQANKYCTEIVKKATDIIDKVEELKMWEIR